MTLSRRTHHDVSEVDDRPAITRRHVGYSVDEHLAEEDDDRVDQPGTYEVANP